jgi:hypothetical protein
MTNVQSLTKLPALWMRVYRSHQYNNIKDIWYTLQIFFKITYTKHVFLSWHAEYNHFDIQRWGYPRITIAHIFSCCVSCNGLSIGAIYPVVNKNSYWKWSFILDLPIEIVISHSYVSLPEGILWNILGNTYCIKAFLYITPGFISSMQKAEAKNGWVRMCAFQAWRRFPQTSRSLVASMVPIRIESWFPGVSEGEAKINK